jgi:membrane-associated phospholipid phosphatase
LTTQSRRWPHLLFRARPEGSVLLAGLQASLLLAMALVVVTSLWKDHLWLGWALVGLTVAAWAPEFRLRRDRLWWFAYVAGIFVYTLLRSYADETAIPVRRDYVIDADRFLFFGTDPVERLQDAFFQTTRVTPLDVFAVLVHWSFFIAPHAGAVLIFLARRELFGRYAVLVAGTMYLGLLLFFLVPTEPPWLAAQAGALDGVYRVMDFVGGRVNGDTYRSFYASLGEPNSVAAMPSIHMGVTFAMYLWARDHYRRAAWPLLAYTAVMGLALVYLAEHYVLDLAVGMVCALVAWLLARRLLPANGQAAR